MSRAAGRLVGGLMLIIFYLLCERVLLFAFEGEPNSGVLSSFWISHGAAPSSWLITAICHSSALSTSILVKLVDRADPPMKAAVLATFHASFATTVSCLTVALVLYGFRRRNQSAEEKQSKLADALTVAFCHVGFGAVTSLLISPFRTEVAMIAGVFSPVLGLFRNLSSNGLLENAIDDAGRFFKAWVGPTWFWAWTLGVLMLLSLLALAGIMRRASRDRPLPAPAWAGGVVGGPLLLALAVTALFKSSSVTTCLLVPFAVERMLSSTGAVARRANLRNVLEAVIGSNIGTTITAALVAINLGEEHWRNGAVVALSHMLLKLTGMVVFSVPAVREKFLDGVSYLGARAAARPVAVLAMLSLVYYAGPYVYLKLFTGN